MLGIFSFLFVYFLFIINAENTPPVFMDQAVDPVGCTDSDNRCTSWAAAGECQVNAAWMMLNCKKSCQSCQGGDNAWQLRNEIATKYGNNSGGIKKYTINKVKVNSMIIKHFEIDETRQIVKMHGKMVLTWNDTQIAWDKKKWNLSWLSFYWVKVWAPSLIQTDAPAANPSQVTTTLLAANYTGQIYMWADFTFNSLCDFDYTYYPFDRQRCCYKIDDQRYYMVKLLVSDGIRKEAASSASNTHPTGWTMNNVDVVQQSFTTKIFENWNSDPFDVETSDIEICVDFKRDSSFVNAQIIGPALAPAMVTLVSFLLGDFRRQMHMIVASLGLQIIALFPLHIRMPPPSGETPALLKFCSFNMAMTCIILLLTVLLLSMSVHQTALPPPRFVDKFIWLSEKCSFCFNGSSDVVKIEDDTNTIVGSSNAKSTTLWAPVAKSIRCFLFVICLILYIIVILACFTG